MPQGLCPVLGWKVTYLQGLGLFPFLLVCSWGWELLEGWRLTVHTFTLILLLDTVVSSYLFQAFNQRKVPFQLHLKKIKSTCMKKRLRRLEFGKRESLPIPRGRNRHGVQQMVSS